jgi:DNA-binding response OmpR family regulator
VPKLLVADDSTTIQRVVELTFASEDIQVVAVGDGDQAIARIPVDRPDIVLVDIAMPKRNGYEVSAFVKNHRELAHVPVLLLAGAFEPVDDTRAREVRSDGVIVKPFDPRQMVARVRELLNATPQPEMAIEAQTTSEHAALDDYFDRLDHALQTRTATRPEVPTVESVLDERPVEPAADRPAIAEDQIDAITSRVLERLSAEPFRDVISAIVREVVRQTSHNSQLPTPNSQRD